MTNKQKALKRERIRLRKSQNPQQVDYRKIEKLRSARTEFWKIKKRSSKAEEKTISKIDTKEAKPEKEKKKEPELEVIEEEPETVEISKELEELYSDDDETKDEESE